MLIEDSEKAHLADPQFQQMIDALVQIISQTGRALGAAISTGAGEVGWAVVHCQGQSHFFDTPLALTTLLSPPDAPDLFLTTLPKALSTHLEVKAIFVAGMTILDEAELPLGQVLLFFPPPIGLSEEDRQLIRALGKHYLGLCRLQRRASEFLPRVAAATAQVRERANHDPLTNLANRTYFLQCTENLIRERKKIANAAETSATKSKPRSGQMFGLLFIDLDRFKPINDSLGHATGDRVLREVATRFAGCLGPEDTLARLGGDEFTVLLPNLKSQKQASEVAQKLLNCLRAPMILGGQELHLGASIGLAFYPQDGRDASTLIQHSDIAMYQAKKTGGFLAYSRSMNADGYKRLTEEGELRKAIEEEQLSVWYQPQVDLKTGAWCGLEALVRWQHPTRGMVAPSHFVQLAEESDLVETLGAFVLRRACFDLAVWRSAGFPKLTVSVNFSARQLASESIEALVNKSLYDACLPGSALEMELTETTLASNLDQIPLLLRRLRGTGIKVAIDDFGTGYSSLAYLRRFPIDVIKIDQTFVLGIGRTESDAALVRAAVQMAHALNIRAIAEGVETPEQLDYLKEIGCDIGQGYLYSPPIRPDQVLNRLIEATTLPQIITPQQAKAA
jgi:diguanylate cyclase (GGDEF)-like protein